MDSYEADCSIYFYGSCESNCSLICTGYEFMSWCKPFLRLTVRCKKRSCDGGSFIYALASELWSMLGREDCCFKAIKLCLLLLTESKRLTLADCCSFCVSYR